MPSRIDHFRHWVVHPSVGGSDVYGPTLRRWRRLPRWRLRVFRSLCAAPWTSSLIEWVPMEPSAHPRGLRAQRLPHVSDARKFQRSTNRVHEPWSHIYVRRPTTTQSRESTYSVLDITLGDWRQTAISAGLAPRPMGSAVGSRMMLQQDIGVRKVCMQLRLLDSNLCYEI